MTTQTNSNNRASLLAGLRTGGVRSSSYNVPHTAAPTGAFNVARFPSQSYPSNYFPEEEEFDQVPELYHPQQQQLYNNRHVPMTAAVDGPANRFAGQQVAPRPMNPNSVPFSPAFSSHMMSAQPQAQIQMLQLEMMRLQVLQAQQAQNELMAAQHAQQQAQAAAATRERRTSLGFGVPATAGPTSNGFDLRAATMRRASQAEQLRSQLGVGNGAGDQVPMTAALGGRFGTRTTSLSGLDAPPTPGYTTVISGGTSLGNLASNNAHVSTPSKSDSASTWRRGGNNNSVLSGNRIVSSPSVKVTPPPSEERVSPPPAAVSPISTSGPKFRPQPLRFSAAVSQPLPAVAIDTEDDTDGETHSSGSSVRSGSSPTTPRSSSSNEMPLSPREEASKKLFEGLGIGRPVSATPSEQQQQNIIIRSISTSPAPGHRVVSQPTRQPRGPPSGADELGPKNFATRIRRKAIGGLGMLMGARERREIVEAY
ncbi:hypothetical protein CPB83DRAFT_335781 [Crepidotus variabilis]|uniref:Uncharacterized protein n=1 Tax=Crepidotus variabilis TaxID=179855 RepID=A0A9P6ET74_9AGAR|nr:hypothetical protein CPB83DRAFT_335781 [Crepidotus variabilis]